MGTPIQWPTELSVMPIQYGMQRTLAGENNYDVTDVDSGEPRRRLKYYTTIAKYNVTFSFDEVKMQIFTSFYMQDLYKGTKAFLVELPHPNGKRVCRCRFDPATYQDAYETYNRWTVTATLEVRDMPSWDTGSQWLLDLFGGDEAAMTVWAAELHDGVQVAYPEAVRGDMYV